MRWSALATGPIAAALLVAYSCDDPLEPPSASPAGTLSKPRLALVGAAVSGTWPAPFSWPIVASHASVLPDRRVITWVSSDVPGDTETHQVHIWDPACAIRRGTTIAEQDLLQSARGVPHPGLVRFSVARAPLVQSS